MCQSAAVPRIHDAAFFFVGIDVRFFWLGGEVDFCFAGEKGECRLNVD